MLLPSNTATHMENDLINDAEERETFHAFFDRWLVEQNQHLEGLVTASKEIEQQPIDCNRILRPKIAIEIEHYEQYYRAKSNWAKNHVLAMFNPSWRSSLEDAFMWIGGWRPSMAFHLLYSKCGIQLEANLGEMMRGVNDLQKAVIREEKEITEKFARQQETVADSSMVELSHAVTEAMREGNQDRTVEDERVQATLGPKEEGLAAVLQSADDLRLKTLKQVVNILSPIQGVYFLIAAAELHLRLHEWGRKRDARHHQGGEDHHSQRN
ncbi:hypothetical protein DH2020_037852 [Rehmannia glutinosa]|uniref:DOG1 domain-containing protein n=1 Tax=Rehmannia glutinosa TaxID=99300 RepID=A0ABR0V1I3_REHGL